MAVLAYTLSHSASATDCSPCTGCTCWTAGGDGHDWFDPSNWTNGVPGAGTDAFVNHGKAEIIGADAVAKSLTIGQRVGDSGTVAVQRANLAATTDSESASITGIITVGEHGTGTLSISDGGGVSCDEAFIARYNGGGVVENSNGTVTIDGGTSLFHVGVERGSQLFVGTDESSTTFEGGTAVLSLSDGGTVLTDNVSGTAPAITVGLSGTVTGEGVLTMRGVAAGSKKMSVHGTVAPVGTLTIGGRLGLSTDATTFVDVTPAGADLVDVVASSQALLRGRVLVALSGTFTRGETCDSRFLILQAEGGLDTVYHAFNSVSFTGVPVNAPYTPQITYDLVAKKVYLDLVFNDCE